MTEKLKDYKMVAVVSVGGDSGEPIVNQLGAVHNTNVDDLKKLLITTDEIDPAEAAPIILDQITPKKSGGGSTRKTHNGGRKHKGKKSRGKGRKSRSKSKSRSKARR
jgi:hypothetical protein